MKGILGQYLLSSYQRFASGTIWNNSHDAVSDFRVKLSNNEPIFAKPMFSLLSLHYQHDLLQIESFMVLMTEINGENNIFYIGMDLLLSLSLLFFRSPHTL
jgi:hypothetical protein